MFAYAVGPIDHWNGWQRPENVFVGGDNNYDTHQISEWPPLWERAKNLGQMAGWEGDIIAGPFVSVLPNEPGDHWPGGVMIAWKQANNGETFVVTPFLLPWLETNSWRIVDEHKGLIKEFGGSAR